MPSLQQVQEHEARMRRQQEDEAARQSRLLNQQAEIDRSRMNQAANIQQQQAMQQANLQAERDLLMGNMQAQRDFRVGGIQEMQQFQQSQYQQQAMEQQARLTGQRDSTLAGYSMQQATHQAQLQADLNQIQLSQQEQASLNRMQQALQRLNEQERNGQLSQDEAADMRTQIMTGINPLQNRATRAEIMRAQVQTAGIHQQNEQVGILFNEQQRIRSMRPEDRIRQFTLADGTPVSMQMTANGDWQVIDPGAAARANMQAQVGAAATLSNVQTNEATRQPTVEGMNLRNMATRQGIDQSAQQFPLSQALLSGRVTAQNLSNQQTAAVMPALISQAYTQADTMDVALQFARDSNPEQLRHMRNSNAIQERQILDLIQNHEARGQAIPLELRRARLEGNRLALEILHNEEMRPYNVSNARSTSVINTERARRIRTHLDLQEDEVRANIASRLAQTAHTGADIGRVEAETQRVMMEVEAFPEFRRLRNELTRAQISEANQQNVSRYVQNALALGVSGGGAPRPLTQAQQVARENSIQQAVNARMLRWQNQGDNRRRPQAEQDAERTRIANEVRQEFAQADTSEHERAVRRAAMLNAIINAPAGIREHIPGRDATLRQAGVQHTLDVVGGLFSGGEPERSGETRPDGPSRRQGLLAAAARAEASPRGFNVLSSDHQYAADVRRILERIGDGRPSAADRTNLRGALNRISDQRRREWGLQLYLDLFDQMFPN